MNIIIPTEQIAFVGPFDPASNPEFKPEKEFKGRVVLLNRDTVLIETSPLEFSEAHDFHPLAEDHVAVNPSLAFGVETFAPTETFKPGKGYRTRIKWRDLDGNEQSKLLVMEPEAVVLRASWCQTIGGYETLAAASGAHAAQSAQYRSGAREINPFATKHHRCLRSRITSVYGVKFRSIMTRRMLSRVVSAFSLSTVPVSWTESAFVVRQARAQSSSRVKCISSATVQCGIVYSIA
jgi:hypothetical protein